MTPPPSKPTFDQRKIFAWLRDTNAGCHFLEGMQESQCRNCERLRDQDVECHNCDGRQRVLVVCGVTPEGKAWLEVYGDARVTVRVQQQLTTDAVCEIDAERLLEMKLPWSFAALRLPGNLKAMHTILPRTPQDEAVAQATLECVKGCLHFPRQAGLTSTNTGSIMGP